MDALYIHIPFCDQICAYCDFAKEITKTDKRKRYMENLEKEIIHHEAALSNIVSIFIGGGTPSILDETDLRNLFAT
ncbi:MAG: radical SAM protein, partial [Bacillota bacterium]